MVGPGRLPVLLESAAMKRILRSAAVLAGSLPLLVAAAASAQTKIDPSETPVQNPAGTITAADFAFKTGNTNNTAAWTPLATAPTVTLRPGAGTFGSTRVSLTWPEGTIKKTWLQVTMLANAATGLAAACRGCPVHLTYLPHLQTGCPDPRGPVTAVTCAPSAFATASMAQSRAMPAKQRRRPPIFMETSLGEWGKDRPCQNPPRLSRAIA